MGSLISNKATDAQLPNYFTKAENQFARLLEMDELDTRVARHPLIVKEFENTLSFALESSYGEGQWDDLYHLFLHRVLYRINRLNFFWYDELSNYKNERSDYLRGIRNRIESVWAQWEISQLAPERIEESDVAEALRRRAVADLTPTPSTEGIYFRDQMGVAGYRKLLEIASLDGLVEASQLSRTLGGVGNGIHSMMTRLLVEEYGGGRLSRKHSSFFKLMLEELGINSTPEYYFEEVPWEVLATINHSFLLSERKLFYLRYVGGLLYTETSVPAAFDNYRLAAERLGMSEKARGYWNLHIKEDERHGRWMLNDIALPLAEMYPKAASEIVLGYDQQKFMSDRAGKAIARIVKQSDYTDDAAANLTERSFEAAA
jgi:hypothetical protein